MSCLLNVAVGVVAEEVERDEFWDETARYRELCVAVDFAASASAVAVAAAAVVVAVVSAVGVALVAADLVHGARWPQQGRFGLHV